MIGFERRDVDLAQLLKDDSVNLVEMPKDIAICECLRKGSTNLVLAKTGMGKSTVLLTMAYSFCRSGRTVLYISLENSPGVDYKRMIQIESAYKMQNFTYVNMSDETIDKIKGIIKAFGDKGYYDIIIVDGIQYKCVPNENEARDICYKNAVDFVKKCCTASVLLLSWQSNRSDANGADAISGSLMVANDASTIFEVGKIKDARGEYINNVRGVTLQKCREFGAKYDYMFTVNVGYESLVQEIKTTKSKER